MRVLKKARLLRSSLKDAQKTPKRENPMVFPLCIPRWE